MIVFYNISCPADHMGLFTIIEIDMEGRNCPEDGNGQEEPKLVSV